MIKDVMVRLDGSVADDTRLAAANEIAERFESHIIGLLLIELPPPFGADEAGATLYAAELERTRAAGDRIEKALAQKLGRLQKPTEIHRFDVPAGGLGDVAAHEARAADAFVALRPNGTPGEPEDLVERVLFGSGRHLFLVPDGAPAPGGFDHIVLAWNGSRESARALAEGMPYFRKARRVTVLVIVEDDVEAQAVLGTNAVNHLKHHDINATLHRIVNESGDVAETLLAEVRRLQAGLIVLGGYGHSRLREWLLGGVTHDLLHGSPVPLVIAH
jgi:nucleotide-binding universal stress UspA family protein